MDQHDVTDPRLREMLDQIPPHDDRARRVTMQAVATTPQRRYRWLPGIGSPKRRAQPAWAGLVAVALIVAGVLLVNDLERSEPGTSGPAPSAPHTVTGSYVCTAGEPLPGASSVVELDPVPGMLIRREIRGERQQLTAADIDDERLAGALTIAWDIDEYLADDAPIARVGTATWILENDDGTWQGSYSSIDSEDGWSAANLPLHGGGGYAGLTAHLELLDRSAGSADRCHWTVRGLIYPSERLLPAPDASAP